ncbi:MAG TPA: peptide ABC transporter substrate-binding protein [Anaerolineae bacterium]
MSAQRLLAITPNENQSPVIGRRSPVDFLVRLPMKKRGWWQPYLLIVAWVLAACAAETETVPVARTRPATPAALASATAEPLTSIEPQATSSDLVDRPVEVTVVVAETSTVAPEATKELIICQAAEPDSLYPYGSNMLAAQNVRHAIYENLYTELGYGYQAQGLEKLPSLADGDAVVELVDASAGDQVVDAAGEVVTLAEGVTVLAANGEEVVFDGSPLVMPQMRVDFTFKPMVWSDGTPVTATDSVYSFELAAGTNPPFTTVDKSRVERTASYDATGDLSVRWTGLPGWLDQQYFLNVWLPLPRHYLEQYSPEELLEAEASARKPLSSGPFVVTEWHPGSYIKLVKNSHYYRAGEGLPYLDSVTFKFVPDTNQLLSQLVAGECHIGTQDAVDVGQAPFLLEAEAGGLVVPHFQSGTVFEHIDFGINSYGDYGDGRGRPDWFEDTRVRQAIVMCTDRQRMVKETLFGLSEIFHAYVPRSHPLYPAGLSEWSYDVAAANSLLDEAGYLDTDGDSIREDSNGTSFRVTFKTTLGAEMRPRQAEIFRENLRDCGIDVELELLPAGEFFADAPEGSLFGRRFDLAEFAWLTSPQPACDLWLTASIPGPEEEGFAGWSGQNNTGWSHPEFDAACQAALRALPGTAEYEVAHQAALRIFAQELPVIPLFARVKAAVARPEVTNFSLDPTQSSELWNLFEIGLLP